MIIDGFLIIICASTIKSIPICQREIFFSKRAHTRINIIIAYISDENLCIIFYSIHFILMWTFL